MDVPEAGKHVKKSTSQKLEDQKKVMMQKYTFLLPLYFVFCFRCFESFFYLLMFVLLLREKQQLGSAFTDVHLYSHASLGLWVGGSFFFFNNCGCFCIPTWCCALCLVIAIYKHLGVWGPPCIFDLGSHGVAMGRGAWVGAGPSPSPLGRHIYSTFAMLLVLAEDG